MGLTRRFGVLAALALSLTVAACGGDPDAGPTSSPSPTGATSPVPSGTPSASGKPETLTFGVYGDSSAVNAYKSIAEAYSDTDPDLTLKVRSWPTQDAMLTDIASGGQTPDVFLAPDASLSDLIAAGTIQPVDSYLDARSVDLGDGYSRNAVEAFSRERRLQCMPYLVSPEVVYVNTDLVDFNAMSQQGLPAPGPKATSWSLDQFQAALQFASRPRQGIRGVYVDPTVAGLAPWLTSAGGSLLDDSTTPTRTAFADSKNALTSLFPILGNNRFRSRATSAAQALTSFENGKLATLVGDRSLVPTLRKANGLHWDVMAMPGGGGTTGDYTGLCMSAKPSDSDAAADFLTYLISSEAVSRLTQSGAIVPVNQQVAYGDTFLQPAQQPSRAQVFIAALKTMHPLPSTHVLGQLDQTVGPEVRRLLTPGGQANLDQLTAQIDDESRTVFGGQPTASATPTG